MIKKLAVIFFSKNRGKAKDEEEALDEDVLECIHRCITYEKNARLNAEVSKEEVKNALWGLSKDKSPRPDDFIVSLFRLI